MDYYFINILCDISLLFVIRKFISDFLQKDSGKKILRNICSSMWLLGTLLANELFHTTVINLSVNFGLVFLITFTYEGKMWKKLLVSVFISVFSASCDLLSYVIMFPVLGEENYFYSFIMTVVFMMLVERVLGAVLRRGFAWQRLSREMLLLSLFPFVSAVILYCVTAMPHGAYQLTACVGILMILLLSMVLYHQLSCNLEEKWKQDILKKEVEAYRRELETMQNYDRKLQNFRHDLRHHLIELESLAEEGKNQKMSAYVREMQKSFDDGRQPVHIGECETDGLIHFLIEEAKNRQIDMKTDIKLPEGIKLSRYGLNVIMGNLLENAVEAAAAATEKQILLSMRFSRGILYVQIKNTFEGAVLIQNGMVVSPNSRKGHGIGLRSVRDLVEENHGKMELSLEGKLFVAEVMIPLADEEES